MADLYEVIVYSVTVDARGFNHVGDAADGRHWQKGALIEIPSSVDAAALLRAGAIKLSSPKGQSEPVTVQPQEPLESTAEPMHKAASHHQKQSSTSAESKK
jgi:hypothetical protein